MDTPQIRPALPADAEAIAQLMSAGMSANVRRMTILGSPLLARWVAGQLESVTGDCFLVAEVEGRAAGMLSSRTLGDTLVLNHLYTNADFRRRGIARALLAQAVRRDVDRAAAFVAVDVFSESRIARQWYAALGFAAEYRRAWLDHPLPALHDPAAARSWSVAGYDEAEAAQARQGFSNFKLKTTSGEYGIGRLSDAVFRTVGFGILADADALPALAALDQRRTLLCIGAPEDLPEEAMRRGRIVEESERLKVSRANLVTRLDAEPIGG